MLLFMAILNIMRKTCQQSCNDKILKKYSGGNGQIDDLYIYCFIL